MKESELHSKVSENLDRFDSMEDITPSDDWNRLLMSRIASETPRTGRTQPTWPVLVMLAFIVINLGVILAFIGSDGSRSSSRSSDLKAVSSEFLINPTSIGS